MRKKAGNLAGGRLLCVVALFLLLLAFCLGGCARVTQVAKADIQFTTGLSEQDLFRIDQEVMKKSEAMVLIASLRNAYEKVYGEEIWKIPVGDQTFEDVVLDSALDLLAQMKCMVLMAQANDIALSEGEKRTLREAAREFCERADGDDMEKAGVGEEEAYQIFCEYRLAHQLIDELTMDVNVEVSDNDARIMQVQQIYFSTVEKSSAGDVPMGEEERREQYEKMLKVKQRLEKGEDFAKLAEIYDDSEHAQHAVARGDMPAAYEEVVFAMEDGEISDIIETEEGYYLVKCLEDYDVDATQAHKEELGAAKKQEAFSQLFDTFTAELPAEFNRNAWNRLSMSDGTKIAGADFFEIYEGYFGD